MLLPDNIQPKLSVYYNASLILKTLYKKSSLDMIDLYASIKKIENMPFNLFLLSLDWLYLINKIDINNQGVVLLCL
ncbi:ABC-three component system middle component 6 [Mycoplasma sp. 06067-C1-B144P-99-0482-3]|uniref:ABC-three component system middle component 6 n=1 Tax=Mycoplasma sp. 06067-C1-B144P-99-0482-3 TaxID=3117438 RepID=UPI003DA2E7DC